MVHVVKIVAILSLSALLQGCGIPHMTRPEGQQWMTQPPQGKALVNFHRPTSFGAGVDYMVFDATQLIGNTRGRSAFQYVCDPGSHAFLGRAQKVSLVEAELGTDKVYDVVVNVGVGWVRANITLEPITRHHPKRAELSEWIEEESLWVFVEDGDSVAAESRNADWIQEAMRDFLSGEKQERSQPLQPDDCR
jgi:hypothetical protein